MKIGRILSILVALGLVGGGVAATVHYGPELLEARAAAAATGARDAIPTAVVSRGPLERTVQSIGELKASRSSIVAAPYRGTVVTLIEEGTRVEEGDPVIWMDTEDLEQELKDQEARLLLAQKDLEAAQEDYRLQEVKNDYDLKSAQARVELAEQRLRDAEQKYESERTLVEARISAQSRLEEAELARLQSAVELRNTRIDLKKTEENLISNLRVKQNSIDRAQLELDRTQKEIEDRKSRIEQAVLKAPVAGEVTYMKIWRSGTTAKLAEGDSVWPRLNLAEIPDRSEMLAIIPVNELDIALVEPEQQASVRLDAIPNEVFPGVVARKSIVPIEAGRNEESTNKPREFEVEIRLDGTDPRLFQGMTAAASIEVQKVGEAFRVPLEALTLEQEALGVFVADGLGPAFRPVSVLLTNDRFAAVEGDLRDGASVYLRHPMLDEQEARQSSFAALQQAIRALQKTQNGAQQEATRPQPPAEGTAATAPTETGA